MSEKILSQEEIDALLKGVATGVVETAPKEAEAPEAVTAFNFSGQDRVVRGRMAALDIIHDRFIKLLTATFTRALHRSIDIRIHRTEIVKFGTVMNQLPLPSSLVIFKMDPLRGNALLAMDAALVYLLAERFKCTKAVGEFKAAQSLPPADPIRETEQVARLRTLGLRPWAPGERDHFICISPVMLNGRRLCAGRPQLTQRPG